MDNRPFKIVLTGAESTGKSTLGETLAKHFNTLWIPEIARNYVENLDRPYTYEDVVAIAKLQIETELCLTAKPSPVFIDEWLINTKVWFEIVYGKSPDWLEDFIKNNSIDLFLVCNIDLPWIFDPVRENRGEKRKMLHKIYLENYEKYGLNFRLVSGIGEKRVENAIQFINEFVK